MSRRHLGLSVALLMTACGTVHGPRPTPGEQKRYMAVLDDTGQEIGCEEMTIRGAGAEHSQTIYSLGALGEHQKIEGGGMVDGANAWQDNDCVALVVDGDIQRGLNQRYDTRAVCTLTTREDGFEISIAYTLYVAREEDRQVCESTGGNYLELEAN